MRVPPLRTWLPPALIAAAIFAVYRSVFGNDFVSWDDLFLIVRNPTAQTFSPQTVWAAFTTYDPELYIPLTLLTYQIESALFGPDPFFFHLDNLLLHTANALLVFSLLSLLLRERTIAFFAALLWALHPLNAEAVAWASARKDVLSTFFLILSTIGYVLYRQGNHRRCFLASLAAFFLGLLAKVSILLLPIALLLIDWREGRRNWREAVAEKLPFFVLSGIFGAIALVGKREVLADSPMATSILMAVKSTAFYFQKLILPTKLSVVYPYHEEISLLSRDFLFPMALLTILVILVVFSLRRTREVTFGSVFFLLMLLPSFTNYAKAGDIFFASDRYAYIASIGLFFLVGSAASALLARRPRLRLPLAGAGSLAVLLLILAAHARSLVWKDSEMLYLDVLGKYPGTPSIQYNLGLVYDERGEDDRAIPYYEEAIRLRPDYADAHNNLGAIFLDRGLLDQAIASFERALQANPNHAKARANLGSAYGKKGMYEEGLRELLRARGGG